MPSATASTRAAEPSIPDFTAAGGRSSASASSWRVTSATGTGSQLLTPTVFWAVTAVTTLVPNTPNWWNVFRSAWTPAPPPESEPAIVRAIFTGAGSLAFLRLGRRGRQRAHRALQLVKHGRVLLAGPGGAGRRIAGDRLLHVGDPVRRHRVGREELLDGAGVGALHVLQDTEHLDETIGIDAGGGGVPHGGVIRRALVFTAELREHGGCYDVERRIFRRPGLTPQHDVAQSDAERRRARLLDLPGAMTQVHVPDLVAHDPRELVVARGVLDQATRHVDVPAGDRERVHVGRVHDTESPWEVAPRGDGDERSEERRVGKECRSRWSPYH